MHLQFDYDICTKCGMCYKVCSTKYIQMDKEDNPYLRENEECIDCGHCVAICPADAVENTRLDSSEFTPKEDVRYIPTGSNEQSLEYVVIQDDKI